MVNSLQKDTALQVNLKTNLINLVLVYYQQ